MGYHTEFVGEFTCTPCLAPNHCAYVKQFSDTRRVKRDAVIASEMPDPIREAVGLPIGVEACNYVGAELGAFLNGKDKSILDWRDYNSPPHGQPGLWCKWAPDDNGEILEWNGHEKFYDYIKWLEYLITNYLHQWGYMLNGEVEWQGEDADDSGIIEVINNTITVKYGQD